MRRETPAIALPPAVGEICATLDRAGERAYVVGGSLRDLLLGREPADWDVATTATPERVMELFGRTVPTGVAHGTVTVLIGARSVEVTTLRGEGAYSDGRRPDRVEFLDDVDEDLARRDFTINAIAWDPVAREMRDPFDGRADLEAGLLRAVGDPRRRFSEDGLRVLRAARFSSALGFRLESATRAAVSACASGLARVSAERKREELSKTLAAPDPTPGLELIGSAGLLGHLSPSAAGLAESWELAVRRAAAVPPRLALRLAALLLDAGEGVACGFLGEMRFDRATRELAVRLVRFAPFGGDPDMPAAELRRALSRLGRDRVEDALELRRAALEADETVESERLGREQELAERCLRELRGPAALSREELAIGGREVMRAAEIAPGPQVGRLLDALLERVLERPELNDSEVLERLAAELDGR
ncbi:MAG: hypothetical protein R6V85_03825 [Polyangia bacterium]